MASRSPTAASLVARRPNLWANVVAPNNRLRHYDEPIQPGDALLVGDRRTGDTLFADCVASGAAAAAVTRRWTPRALRFHAFDSGAALLAAAYYAAGADPARVRPLFGAFTLGSGGASSAARWSATVDDPDLAADVAIAVHFQVMYASDANAEVEAVYAGSPANGYGEEIALPGPPSYAVRAVAADLYGALLDQLPRRLARLRKRADDLEAVSAALRRLWPGYGLTDDAVGRGRLRHGGTIEVRGAKRARHVSLTVTVPAEAADLLAEVAPFFRAALADPPAAPPAAGGGETAVPGESA